MLDYDDNDTFETTFMSTFSVSYTDMYSCEQTVSLKENGDQIAVTIDNREVHTCISNIRNDHTL